MVSGFIKVGGEKMNNDDVFLTTRDQIDRLKKKGLNIGDESLAASFLQETSYSTLVGYYSPFFYNDKEKKLYINGTTFDEVYSLYQFNHDICALYLTYILAAERKLKTIIADCFAEFHTPTAYWDPESFSYSAVHDKKLANGEDNPDSPDNLVGETSTRYSRLIEEIEAEIERKYRDPVLYTGTPFEDYQSRRREIPIWLLVNTFSFGLLRDFYNSMQEKDKHTICGRLKIQYKEFEAGLALLNSFRNRCAHLERVIDFYHKRKIKTIKGNRVTGIYCGVYGVTYFLKQLLPATEFMTFFSALNKCFDELAVKLHAISLADIKQKGMRFPSSDNVILEEMGTYSNGVILSHEEFKSLLQRYIIPMIPCSACKPEFTDPGKPIKKIGSGLMFYNEEDTALYFSQSNESNYSIKVTIPDDIYNAGLHTHLETHLKNLIHYLQIVWNSNKATTNLKSEESAFLFETNSEIAYQLALCENLCQQETTLFKEKQLLKNDLAEIGRELNKAQKAHSQADIDKARKKQSEKANELNQKNDEISAHLLRCSTRRETLYSILSCFDRWAVKTYEGKHMPFGIIINNDYNGPKTFNYIKFLKQDYSATISDGLYSCVEIMANGQYKCHIATSSKEESLDTIPYPHQGFAQQCDNGKIGVLLTEAGDIIIIKDKTMICSKHNGHWTYNNHEYAIRKILDHLTDVPEEDRDKAAHTIYRTLIDVSYSHGGACIAIAEKPLKPELLRMAYPTLLNDSDKQIVSDAIEQDPSALPLSAVELDSSPQSEFRLSALKGFAGNFTKYYNLDCFLRRELIEMDGALILGPQGEIHAVASIINPNGASVYSGGRTTAAIRLSKHGLGIKVSQDGYIKFYENGDETLSI